MKATTNDKHISDHSKRQRRQVKLEGLIQGVGFRPFVYRLAIKYGQTGWVANTGDGVVIDIEGNETQQHDFLTELRQHPPPYTQISHCSEELLPLAGFQTFEVRHSLTSARLSLNVSPDIACCDACVAELFDPDNRFYRYPFTSCCHCGPRYSILKQQPYDRINTTLADFPLCPACQTEYQDPTSRRFHAQTLACPVCGPQLSLLDARGELLAEREQALAQAAQALQEGQIVALKGIGGYQLLADATNENALRTLRKRKHRPRKPLAVMFATMADVEKYCSVDVIEQQQLLAAAAPIVLLKHKGQARLAASVAPDNPLLGVMLPYSPLHHLLLSDFGGPVVATSGNRQNEPICTDQQQASERLQGIADLFLTHNRAILRPLDDSIVRVIAATPTPLRRARGYVPAPIALQKPLTTRLAVGGQLKNTLAINLGDQVIVSQHLGDLDHALGLQQWLATGDDLQNFFGLVPERIIHDQHPDYATTQWALRSPQPKQAIQHHYAHILSCMAEHGISPPALGIAWDGVGLGADGTLWGGEFLLIRDGGFQRFAHFRPFELPGGSSAIREPRRAALGLLHTLFADRVFKLSSIPSLQAFTPEELTLLQEALPRGINTPHTSSVGRLFDAIASLCGICQINSYEGEAALGLEAAAMAHATQNSYPFSVRDETLPTVVDWRPIVEAILTDYAQTDRRAQIAARFHNTLAEIAVALAQTARQPNVVMSGGCFQNAVLVERMIARLSASGFRVFRHQQLPPNDGGLSLGQLAGPDQEAS